MADLKKINTALISVYHKDNLDVVVRKLHNMGVSIISTGGTASFITGIGVPCTKVESITGFPPILGGRVKTLHPKIFGGILGRRDYKEDEAQLEEYKIPKIDLVIVDLYPFEKTVESGSPYEDIIEKIDIGGISLIRAAAKNCDNVLVVPTASLYGKLLELLHYKEGYTSLNDRKEYAAWAFHISSAYDTAIFNYFNSSQQVPAFKFSIEGSEELRYGENPHQKGFFHGQLKEVFEQLNGKELSYNNLVDAEAAVHLIAEFSRPTFAIIKHTNACGIASRDKLSDAWKDALAGDPISAFGGVLITNRTIDSTTAEEINKLFFEVLIAPGYDKPALTLLTSKKNRIILKQRMFNFPGEHFKTILNGVIRQDRDIKTEKASDLKPMTLKTPSSQDIRDMLFACIVAKYTKSNTIVLAKNEQLLGCGTGQTSRVDALRQAMTKAKEFSFDLHGAVMASDAFFPFPDCVELAHKAGINSVIQPGGSVKDNESIEYCNKNGMCMAFTGIRHFKH